MSAPRSLAKDQADVSALHSPRWREQLDAEVRAQGEQVPFFYTRAGAVLPLEGQYRAGHAFLMANGPSVANLDLSPLQRRWVMTLNNGVKTFRGNANCIVDDPSRFSLSMWLDPTIMKFAPMSHFEKLLWDNRMLHTEEAGSRDGSCPSSRSVIARTSSATAATRNFMRNAGGPRRRSTGAITSNTAVAAA